MNIDKRYCQNRQRKRKRTIVPSPIESRDISPSEEERQFKLSRFVEDVGHFLSEKETFREQKVAPKTSTKARKTVKKVTIPKPLMKRSLFENSGMRTKFCKRDVSGVMSREMTARLDENLQQIISLANSNQCNQRCHCKHHCTGKIEQKSGSFRSPEHTVEPKGSSILRPLQPRSSTTFQDLHPSLSSPHGVIGGETMTAPSEGAKNGAELDKELYPLFTRVVSVSCTKTKSALFKNQSYVSAVKRKLVEMYVNGVKEDKQEISCLKESQKATSSVGTSPFPSPLKPQSSLHSNDPPFKLAPAKLRFQSTMQFLEENIGPSSTYSSSNRMAPSPPHRLSNPQCSQQPVQYSQRHLQYRQPLPSLLSPPVIEYYYRPQRNSWHIPKASKYVHEPFLPSYSPLTPFQNLKSSAFDGSGDRFRYNCFNSFLPPIEEEDDSPDLRYFPRKIF